MLLCAFKKGLNEAAWTLRHMSRSQLLRRLGQALKKLEHGEDFNHLVKAAAQRFVHTDGGMEMRIILCINTFIRIRHLLRQFPDVSLFIDRNLRFPHLKITVTLHRLRWPRDIVVWLWSIRI